jgi:hypothetical protein
MKMQISINRLDSSESTSIRVQYEINNPRDFSSTGPREVIKLSSRILLS